MTAEVAEFDVVALTASPRAVGLRIRELRVGKGLSQARLGYPELSGSYVSLIESGKRTPTPSAMRSLARKLGCPQSFLLTGVDEARTERLRSMLAEAQEALDTGDAVGARTLLAMVLEDPAVDWLPELAQESRWMYALAIEATGAIELAERELAQIAETLRPGTDPDRWAELHIALCRCRRERGDLAGSIQLGEKALYQLTAAQPKWTKAMVMLGVAVLNAYREQPGQLIHADRLAEHLVDGAVSSASPRAITAAHLNAAWFAAARGEPEYALVLVQRAIGLVDVGGDAADLCRLRGACGRLLLLAWPEQAEYSRVILRRTEHEMIACAIGDADLASCIIDQARAEILLGRPTEAATIAARAIALLDDAAPAAGTGTAPAGSGAAADMHDLGIIEALSVLAAAHLGAGRRDAAVTALTDAGDRLTEWPASRATGPIWWEIAELLGATDQTQRQEAAFRHALACMGL